MGKPVFYASPAPDDSYDAGKSEGRVRRQDDDPIRDNERLYYEALKTVQPPLSREKELELARRSRNGDECAKQRLAEALLRYVVSIAKRYRHESRLDFLDLIQYGNVGLMEAIEHFDPDKGCRLTTIATYYIKQAIWRGIEKTRGISKRQWEHYRDVERVHDRLMRELLRAPTLGEIAERLGMTIEEVGKYLNAFKILDAFSEVSDEQGDDGQKSTDQQLEAQKIWDWLAKMNRAGKISDQRMQVFSAYYIEDKSEHEIAEEVGIAPNLVRQHLHRLRDKIREHRMP